MSFFAKLKADVEAVEAKIKSLITVEGPKLEDVVRTETLALVKQLIVYVEAFTAAAPGLGTAVAAAEAAVAPKVEAAIDAAVEKV